MYLLIFLSDCRTLPFYVDEDVAPVDHKAMKIKGQFYGADLPDMNARVLELPYEDKNFRMLVFLPDEDSSIHELDRSMTNLDLKGLDKRLEEAEYEVQMPKFKADTKQDMKEVLTDMGIRTLFDNPDLSDIATPEIAGGGLRVSSVIHQAAVEVSEEGTEAAAATAIGIAIRTAKPKKKGGEFTVDRPFMFVIQDMEKGVPLFMGRIVDPTGTRRLASSRGRRESAPSIDASSNVFGERQGGERIKHSERRPEQLEIQDVDTEDLNQADLPECPEGYQAVAEPNISFPCRGRDTMVLEAAQEERAERMEQRRERAFHNA